MQLCQISILYVEALVWLPFKTVMTDSMFVHTSLLVFFSPSSLFFYCLFFMYMLYVLLLGLEPVIKFIYILEVGILVDEAGASFAEDELFDLMRTYSM